MTGSTRTEINSPPDFTASLNTSSAYHQNVGNIATSELYKQFGQPTNKHVHILTCMQEACSNAIVHGNLEIDGHFRNLSDFHAHYAQIEKRLQEATYRNRAVTIKAWKNDTQLIIAVTDQGKGFNLPSHAHDKAAPYGRGLHIIKSLADDVWLGEDRHTLYMLFKNPL